MTIHGTPPSDLRAERRDERRHRIGDLAAHQQRQMPAAICIIASVMMKDGMPIRVTPKALTAPSAKQAASASMIAAPPGSGMLAMFTLASCSVKNATTMPVALAIAGDR